MAAFLANFQCGTGAAGAPALTLNLVVSNPMTDDQPPQPFAVGGIGTITQAVNPPVDVTTNISGITHPAGGGTVAAMIGVPAPGTQTNFQGVLVLPQGWGQDGTITYRYLRDGQFVNVGPVPARPIAAEKAA